MNRIKAALLVLCGHEPEPRIVNQEVPVYGEAREVVVYRLASSFGFGIPQRSVEAFLSCEQAFKTQPGGVVVSESVWEIGGKYYTTPRLSPIEVQPKPKIEKGREHGDGTP